MHEKHKKQREHKQFIELKRECDLTAKKRKHAFTCAIASPAEGNLPNLQDPMFN